VSARALAGLFVLTLAGCGGGELDTTTTEFVGGGDAQRPSPDAGSTDAGDPSPLADARRDATGPRPPTPDARDPDPVSDASAPPPPADTGPPPAPDAAAPACAPAGTFDCPIVVDRFPYTDTRDTTSAPSDAADTYVCRPQAQETGPEYVYRVRTPDRGLLSARLDAPPEGGPDIDVHLLDGPAADSCVSRDNLALSRTVEAGDHYVVADTWADADGVEYAGPYTLTITFQPVGDDACALQDLDLEMVWRGCAAGVDCYESPDADGTPRRFLRTPATGPVVREAHLVTVADDFGGGWPGSFTEGIEAHYALSEAATGYHMDRGEPWAPAGEGGSEFGQGSFGGPLPVEDEAFYVNMYWRRPPPPGSRLLIRNPETGAAVVAAGGYETGPGNNAHIGGVTEEIHHALGTGHLSTLQLGFLVDQTLPLGPIDCP
jgi:hypothetical protein